ncbi:MAG: UTRA domain-containing protein [Oscillospiraceae bacterium]
METIPLLLRNDQLVYDVLAQLGALSGKAFPSKEQLLWQTGLPEDLLAQSLEHLCQQKILQRTSDGFYTAFSAKPIYLHYRSFRSFGQMLECPGGAVSTDLLSVGPIEASAYTSEVLRIPKKETVIRIVRLYSRDGIPFAYEEYDVLYALLKNTPKAQLQKTPVLHVIQNNLPPTSFPASPLLVQSQYFFMTSSNDKDQKYLHLPLGENILQIVGRAYHEEKPLCAFIVRADANQCFLKGVSTLHFHVKKQNS